MAVVAQRRYHGRATELLDELQKDQHNTRLVCYTPAYLFKRLVVDEAGGIFWDLQLPLLDVLAELPREASRVSSLIFGGQAGAGCSLPQDTSRTELKGLHMRGTTYIVTTG